MERFLRRDRNVAAKPSIPNHQTMYAYTIYAPYLSNHDTKVWHYTSKTMVCQVSFVIYCG